MKLSKIALSPLFCILIALSGVDAGAKKKGEKELAPDDKPVNPEKPTHMEPNPQIHPYNLRSTKSRTQRMSKDEKSKSDPKCKTCGQPGHSKISSKACLKNPINITPSTSSLSSHEGDTEEKVSVIPPQGKGSTSSQSTLTPSNQFPLTAVGGNVNKSIQLKGRLDMIQNAATIANQPTGTTNAPLSLTKKAVTIANQPTDTINAPLTLIADGDLVQFDEMATLLCFPTSSLRSELVFLKSKGIPFASLKQYLIKVHEGVITHQLDPGADVRIARHRKWNVLGDHLLIPAETSLQSVQAHLPMIKLFMAYQFERAYLVASWTGTPNILLQSVIAPAKGCDPRIVSLLRAVMAQVAFNVHNSLGYLVKTVYLRLDLGSKTNDFRTFIRQLKVPNNLIRFDGSRHQISIADREEGSTMSYEDYVNSFLHRREPEFYDEDREEEDSKDLEGSDNDDEVKPKSLWTGFTEILGKMTKLTLFDDEPSDVSAKSPPSVTTTKSEGDTPEGPAELQQQQGVPSLFSEGGDGVGSSFGSSKDEPKKLVETHESPVILKTSSSSQLATGEEHKGTSEQTVGNPEAPESETAKKTITEEVSKGEAPKSDTITKEDPEGKDSEAGAPVPKAQKSEKKSEDTNEESTLLSAVWSTIIYILTLLTFANIGAAGGWLVYKEIYQRHLNSPTTLQASDSEKVTDTVESA